MIELFPSREIVMIIGPLTIRWYGLLYVIAAAVGVYLLSVLQKQRNVQLSTDQLIELLVAALFGVVVGGRLGYVFFYEPVYFWQHPGEIVALWHGGMSSHGGIIGVAATMWYLARRYRVNMWLLLDLVVIPAAIGLSLGRLGNYINQELYGLPTMLPWGIQLSGEVGRRHPVHLYEAVTNLLVALVLAKQWYRARVLIPGELTAMFLILYGSSRLVVSFWRVLDVVNVTVSGHLFSLSQVLTAALVVAGFGLLYRIHQVRTNKIL